MADLRFVNHDTTIQTNLKESLRTVLTKESTALFPVFHQTAPGSQYIADNSILIFYKTDIFL